MKMNNGAETLKIGRKWTYGITIAVENASIKNGLGHLALGDLGCISSKHDNFLSYVDYPGSVQIQTRKRRDPNIICSCPMAMNFAVIHTSTFTTVNLLLDTLSRSVIFHRIQHEVRAASWE
jgi:hypothetical protein